jgi:hypothetical protein
MVSTPYGLTQYEWETKLTQALAQQVGEIHLAAQVAQLGLAQIAQTHQLAAQLSAETLAQVDRLLQEAAQANRLTPFKVAALDHLRMVYLFEMLAAVEETGQRLITVVSR